MVQDMGPSRNGPKMPEEIAGILEDASGIQDKTRALEIYTPSFSLHQRPGLAFQRALRSMAAPNVAADGLEVILTPYRFDANDLRWLPTGEAAAKVRMSKEAAKNWRLVLGQQSLPLSEIRKASAMGPHFLVLDLEKQGHVGLRCEDELGLKQFTAELLRRKADYERFEQYDQSSVQSYFQYYAKLSNQQSLGRMGFCSSGVW
eukprot:g261.t1